MKKGRRNCISLAGAVASAIALSATSLAVSAEVINVPCNVSKIVNAINTANNSPEDSVLELATSCTYTLTDVNNTLVDPSGLGVDGPNGLPAILRSSTSGKLTINGHGSTIARSSADGIPPFRILFLARESDLTMRDLTLEGGYLLDPEAAGGVYEDGAGVFTDENTHLTLQRCAVRNNDAYTSGGIASHGTLALLDSKIENNSGRNANGGLRADGSILISNSSISHNRAGADAGLFAGGDVYITKSQIVGNMALGPYASYAGAELIGTIKIEDSTIAGNTAEEQEDPVRCYCGIGGVGINPSSGSPSSITNTTISGNSAPLAAGLLIVDNGDVATVTLNNVTIVGNKNTLAKYPTQPPYLGVSTAAGLVTGNYFTNVTVITKNSIVAMNTPSNCDATQTGSLGVNLDSDGSCPGFAHTTVEALRLAPLANNGGPTETHSLLPGSIAIDAAADCTTVDGKAITTDQRGVIRPQGKACDVGAFERGDELYVVNNLVSFNVVPGTAKLANDLVGCSGFAKKYRFSALLTNSSYTSTPTTLTNLAMQVRKLSGGNKLFLDGSATLGTLYGEGEHTALPLAGGYADGQLAPRENETVGVNVCLAKVAPFQLLVDVLGKTQ